LIRRFAPAEIPEHQVLIPPTPRPAVRAVGVVILGFCSYQFLTFWIVLKFLLVQVPARPVTNCREVRLIDIHVSRHHPSFFPVVVDFFFPSYHPHQSQIWMIKIRFLRAPEVGSSTPALIIFFLDFWVVGDYVVRPAFFRRLSGNLLLGLARSFPCFWSPLSDFFMTFLSPPFVGAPRDF